MSITPYVPASFATPIANPAVGGAGVPYPYVSVSQYKYAGTGVDISNLYPDGEQQDQDQALATILREASAWADRICFGADPAAKGASLCATLSVETASVPVIRGELRLVCDYKPVVQVNGIDIGADMSSLTGIGADLASRVRIGRRTIYVPLAGVPFRNNTAPPLTLPPNTYPGSRRVLAVWSYVNGYPHSLLTGTVTAGQSTCTVMPTDGGTGLLGVIPGVSRFTIVDRALTETFTVQSVSGTEITSATPFLHNHTAPPLPDSIPVTTLPEDAPRAVIFLANVLIKTEGDNSIVLAGLTEPKAVQRMAGDQFEDYNKACQLLRPWRVHDKRKN